MRFLLQKRGWLLPPSPATYARPRSAKDRQVSVNGVGAKRLVLPYRLGECAMPKVADCVVGGFCYEIGRKMVGSLLLGLYYKMDFCSMLESPPPSPTQKSPP
jgi:hypothetical protein